MQSILRFCIIYARKYSKAMQQMHLKREKCTLTLNNQPLKMWTMKLITQNTLCSTLVTHKPLQIQKLLH